ncbi:flagellar biosynthesis protein FliQ [Buchnera aphidicola (Mindarus keteleerifoliae)]|uniref:flagellar biosynthesis protein FliQ n=1 Tax=Buchnera aphidicola TaxID=9 RepID=UPI0031B7256D
MSSEYVVTIFKEALKVTLMLSLPLLLVSLITGLVVGVFQAVTQINEQTLSFIPKMISVIITLFFLGPWMLRIIKEFFYFLFNGFQLNN